MTIESSVVAERLVAIEQRVLWLAVRIIDFANRERPNDDGLKVGGHQASSASLVTLMTALYFSDLDAADRVSVKPHASPVLHAIEYLLGRLDRSYLTRLRDFGGLQSYPSRTKDPFAVDYSTGSVGLGSVAPLFGALADRYVSDHFGEGAGGRFISLLGDAELDEGSIWEAIAEPLTRGLGNVLWLVDLNRQSLDRVIPGSRAAELQARFAVSGWHVIELKYGSKLQAAFELDGGDVLRERIDAMSNEQYQRLFGASDDELRSALLDPLRPTDRRRLEALVDRYDDLRPLVRDLAGHDLNAIRAAFADARAEPDRPTVIFAYTIKGYGLEIAGRAENHSALLTGDQIDRLRADLGLTLDTEWDRFAPDAPEGEICAAAARRLARADDARPPLLAIPERVTTRDERSVSTQATFGRLMLELARTDTIAERLVTVSPDVSVSTNLGGFINKVGVWGAEADGTQVDSDATLRWHVSPAGQHIEVGIAEMNLVLLLGQLGLAADYRRERLIPVGTLYDPFVMRALEGIVYSVYSDARFVIVGTPSGISLSREGGAHQSLNTPGIGMETPGLWYAEPCYALELEWLLLDGIAQMQLPCGESLYLRLSTKVIDQGPFTDLVARRGEESVRSDVLRGGFVLREAQAGSDDRVLLATCGALVPETLAAAEQLADEEGVEAAVIVISSPDRLYREWRHGLLEPLEGRPAQRSHLDALVADTPNAPVVSVIDGASHALAWLGSAVGRRCVPLGVDRFGQVGSQSEVYREFQVDTQAIVTAALVALEPGS